MHLVTKSDLTTSCLVYDVEQRKGGKIAQLLAFPFGSWLLVVSVYSKGAMLVKM